MTKVVIRSIIGYVRFFRGQKDLNSGLDKGISCGLVD